MITKINSLDKFGVFNGYTSPVDIEDFVEKNIIYGWNYSGKTMLSRLFASLENGRLHKDYPEATFDITSASIGKITQDKIHELKDMVRVFNSEFVDNNLSWNGGSFHPILLLGEKSIEAEKKISKNLQIIEISRKHRERRQAEKEKVEGEIDSWKVRTARFIKNELSIVDAFDKRHLEGVLSSVKKDPASHLLSSEEHTEKLKVALTIQNDVPEAIPEISVNPNLTELYEQISKELVKAPEMSNVLDCLKNDEVLSDWVETGLGIHEDKTVCEFCGNEIPQNRIAEFKGHFSNDLKEHKERLSKLVVKLNEDLIDVSLADEAKVNHEIKKEYVAAKEEMSLSFDSYNMQVKAMIDVLEKKAKQPFKPISDFKINGEVNDAIKQSAQKLNNVISRNNELSKEFSSRKSKAISSLKKYFVADSFINEDIPVKEKVPEKLGKHVTTLVGHIKKLQRRNDELEASISDAQKGKDELNKHICNFLGHEELLIKVVKEEGVERFRLYRGDKVAKNLSEGEKTAISFSFFLTKLGGIDSPEDVVVYIDDPISSLDSNHIFQVYSLLNKVLFFHKEVGGNKAYFPSYKQIFISTHNFEFFTLLTKLPSNKKTLKTKYFHTKRIDKDRSTFINLPESIIRHSSEYHYLYSLLHKFHISSDKTDIELLLSIPNALRRFLELYTYTKIPRSDLSVDARATELFSEEKSQRIMKVLHHFSHSNNVESVQKNSDLLSDVENVVNDIMEILKGDKLHHQALMHSI